MRILALSVVFAGAACATAAVAPKGTRTPAAVTVARDTVSQLPSSAEWLALLPDGEEKRRFILDCTGCHQFDERIARVAGTNGGPSRSRTRAEWEAAVTRMMNFAGAGSNFPIISAYRNATRTAEWLATNLPDRLPQARREVPSAAVTEFMFPVARDLPHDVAVRADGHIVVTGMFTHRMHVLDPATSRWEEVAIPVPNANPRAVEIDSIGNWWVVLGGPRQLARYHALSGLWRTWGCIRIHSPSRAAATSGSTVTSLPAPS